LFKLTGGSLGIAAGGHHNGVGIDPTGGPERVLADTSSSGNSITEVMASSSAAGGPASSDEPLLLNLQLDSNRDGVLEFLHDNGVIPSNVAGDYLEVYVPPSLLGDLAQQTGVSRVREMPDEIRARMAGDT